MGTPINTPIMVRIKRIQPATFKVQVKLLPQGALSRIAKTTTATAPTQERAKAVLSNRIIEITNPTAHIHQVNGCSCSCFNSLYFLRVAGVGISTPHSFAGNPLRPQINPEPAARIFTI